MWRATPCHCSHAKTFERIERKYKKLCQQTFFGGQIRGGFRDAKLCEFIKFFAEFGGADFGFRNFPTGDYVMTQIAVAGSESLEDIL